MRLTFLLHSPSHYHAARMRALSAHCDLRPIFVSRRSSQYGLLGEGATANTLSENEVSPKEEVRLVRKALGRSESDVVFVPGWGRRFSRAAIDICSQSGRPFVLISDTHAAGTNHGFVRTLFKLSACSAASAFFVAGMRARAYLQSLNVPSFRIFDGYDVVDTQQYELTSRDTPHPLPFLVVARLLPIKNVESVLRALAMFPTLGGVRIAGDGPLISRLQSVADNLKVTSRVEFLEHVAPERLPELYARARCVILPSVSETWGLTINEAIASGCAVLVSEPCGCAPDLVRTGRNGFRFLPHEEADLGRKMFEVLELDQRQLAKTNKELNDSWNLDRFVSGALAAARLAHSLPTRRRPFLARRLNYLPQYLRGGRAY